MIVVRLFSVFLLCLDIGYLVLALALGQVENTLRVGGLVALSILLLRYRSYLIEWMELPMQVLIFLWVVGGFYNYYESIWWYDEMAHFVGPMILSVYSLNFLQRFFPKELPQWFYVFGVVNFNIALTVIWEFYEYYFAYIVLNAFQMVLGDTISDLLLGFAGAVLVGVFYYYRFTLLNLYNLKMFIKLWAYNAIYISLRCKPKFWSISLFTDQKKKVSVPSKQPTLRYS